MPLENQPKTSFEAMSQLGAVKKPEPVPVIHQPSFQSSLPENKMNIISSPQGPSDLDKHNYGMDFVNQEPVDTSKMTPEILAAIAGIFGGESAVEKITNAPNPEQRKYWLYDQLGRIVDFNESWPAQSLREAVALRVSSKSDALLELTGEKLTPKEIEKKKGNKQALTIIEDVDKVFDQWFSIYKQLGPSGKIFQMVFNPLPEYMPPEFFARVYGEMPGIKENEKEWKSVSDQIDIGIRAFMYLGLQSDPRMADDLKWFREGGGFKKLFANETTEKEWLLKLKLKTLPNEVNEVADLYQKDFDKLTDDDKARLDNIPAFNRFADANNGGTVKATMDAVRELMCEGIHKDSPVMKFQSQFALNLADKSFRMLGLAAQYGTHPSKMENGRATKVVNEGAPWNDFWVEVMHPQDKVTYNRQNSYWEGPVAWANFAPERMMVDFLRMTPVRDSKFPDSKGHTQSAMELFVEGKTIGQIMKDEDHIGDWSYRAYLIRPLFLFREDTGAHPALSGELANDKNVKSRAFWEGVEKSIHITCRDWIITNGRNEKWFEDHKSEVDAMVDSMAEGNNKFARIHAEDELLKKYILKEKNRWKAVCWLSSIETTLPHERESIINTAANVGFLDKTILQTTKNLDFTKKNTPEGLKALLSEMKTFIDKAANSGN